MALTQSECQEFVLEIIGVMGNLALPDLDYSQILQRCNLIPWIRNILIPGRNIIKVVIVKAYMHTYMYVHKFIIVLTFRLFLNKFQVKLKTT